MGCSDLIGKIDIECINREFDEIEYLICENLIYKNVELFGEIISVNNFTFKVKRISDNKYLNGTINYITFNYIPALENE